MSARADWTLRVADAGRPAPRASDYWRTRPASERLAEVLALHCEGNALFGEESPGFAFVVEGRHVPPAIGLDDLRRNKKAVGRLQDLADLEQLED